MSELSKYAFEVIRTGKEITLTKNQAKILIGELGDAIEPGIARLRQEQVAAHATNSGLYVD